MTPASAPTPGGAPAVANNRFTRPSTPKTNGPAERFIQTSFREWAYVPAFSHSDQRSARRPLFLQHRPHHAPKLRSPKLSPPPPAE